MQQCYMTKRYWLFMLLGGILLVRLQTNDLPTPYQSTTSSTKNASKRDDSFSWDRLPIARVKRTKKKPWESIPAKAVPLEPSNDSFQGRRHSCVKAIRQQHQELFLPLWKPQDFRLLLDPAYHGNVGDHMLTMGELEMIAAFNQSPPTQCHYTQASHYYEPCPDIISMSQNQTKIALWHAGGNWGDLWRHVQTRRLASFQILLENGYQIIGMPQSLHYGDADMQEQDLNTLKQSIVLGLGLVPNPDNYRMDHEQTWYEYFAWWSKPPTFDTTQLDTPQGAELAKSRLTFTWREEKSYLKALQLYPFAHNRLVPDVAFNLGPYAPIRRDPALQVDLMIFMRLDKESTVRGERNDRHIRSLLPKSDITFRIADWKDRLDIFDSGDELFTDTAIQLLSLGKVVICDRLHASILSYLVGIPFVYIDQVSKKISSTLETALKMPPEKKINGIPASKFCWEEHLKSKWAQADSMADAIVKAVDLLDSLDKE